MYNEKCKKGPSCAFRKARKEKKKKKKGRSNREKKAKFVENKLRIIQLSSSHTRTPVLGKE